MIKPSAGPLAFPGERPLPETVSAFLVESERRVLLHCRKLLAQDVPSDERQRLLRLAEAADQELQRIVVSHESAAA